MDKNYPQLKQKAIRLRKKGLSYNEIKKELNVPKSTLSIWLKTVPLTTGQREHFYTKRILNLSRGPQSQKERRIREIDRIIQGAEEESSLPLSLETHCLLGAVLYWAEGDKTKGFTITNSDPNFIIFMVRWFEKVFQISPRNLKAWLNIYPQQNDLGLKHFWSRLTAIPIENFGKSFIKPINKGYKKNNLYYGTIKVRAPKGTDMRHRVFGWVKAALKENSPQVELVQKEWKSLREVPRPVNIPENIKI